VFTVKNKWNLVMNPFQHINPKIGMKVNKTSPFYGRFRLEFNQAYPFREPTYNRALLKIKKECVEKAKMVHELLPEHIYLFFFHQQKDIKENKYIQINCFENEDCLFEVNLLSDVIYIAMENFYFALLELSPFLEDFHFFIYSTGDQDDRWLDEYNNKNGQLTCNRILCDMELFYGRIAYYINRVNNTPDNRNFKLFTTWQIYDKLNFLFGQRNILNKEESDKKDKRFIDVCTNAILLDNFFINLKKIYQCLLVHTSEIPYKSLMTNFTNWCSANQI
jgi:hypothetical protein